MRVNETTDTRSPGSSQMRDSQASEPQKKEQACTYVRETGSVCDEFTLDPRPTRRPPRKPNISLMNSGYARYSGLNLGVFGGARCEVRADLSVSMLRLASCVYRFPLHLLGLRSECTQGLSTGEPRKEQKKKKKGIYVKRHVNTSLEST